MFLYKIDNNFKVSYDKIQQKVLYYDHQYHL